MTAIATKSANKRGSCRSEWIDAKLVSRFLLYHEWNEISGPKPVEKNLLHESRSLKSLTPTEIKERWGAVYLWDSRTNHLLLCTNYRLCAVHTSAHPHADSYRRLNCKPSTPNRSEIRCLKKGYSLNLFLSCFALEIQAMLCSISLSQYTLSGM